MSPLIQIRNTLKSIPSVLSNIVAEAMQTPEIAVAVFAAFVFVILAVVKLLSAKKSEGFDGVVTGATATSQGLGMGQTGLVDNSEETLDSYFQEPVPVSVEKKYESDVKEKLETDKGVLNSSEFLPQELNVDWFDKDFNSIQEIDQETLIDVSKYSSPVDTVGQSLKNPSYDIRGNIMNPKSIISPFLNSSIEPDTNIKTWC